MKGVKGFDNEYSPVFPSSKPLGGPGVIMEKEDSSDGDAASFTPRSGTSKVNTAHHLR